MYVELSNTNSESCFDLQGGIEGFNKREDGRCFAYFYGLSA